MFHWFLVGGPGPLTLIILICSACQINKLSASSSSSLLLSALSTLSSSLSLSSAASFPGFDNLPLDKELFSWIHRSRKLNVRSDQLKRRNIPFRAKGRRRFQRHERTDQDCTAGLCCLKSVYFDFHEHGMDFIVRPSGFNMNFCEGECSTHIQTTDRDFLISHDGASHPESPFKRRLSCCVPIRWDSIEVVENKNGIESSRTLKDVKVVECGCAI